MLYNIVRPLATAAFYVYFRKIYLTNQERIPRNKPVILACNHPTAFMEPCILACFLDRPLYFLVRGDFFVNPFYARLLRDLNMLPVYRWKDGGYSKLRENFSTFEACHRALRANRTIMIFAEGNTKYEKRLRPLQKGPVRIALGALDRFPEIEDVYIVPTGVTYTQADRFRSEVMIDFGEPLSVRSFSEQYRQNQQEGVNQLLRELEEKMRAQLVHVEHPKDDMLVEYLLELDRSQRPSRPWPLILRDEEPLRRERRLAKLVNGLPAAEHDALQRRVYAYFNQLEQLELEDRQLAPAPPLPPAGRLLLALGLVPALTGYVLNFLPLWAARRLADIKVPHIEFYSPVMVATGIGLYLLYWLILLLATVLAWGSWGVLAALAAPVLGMFCLWYLDVRERWRTGRMLKGIDAGRLDGLHMKRKELLEHIVQQQSIYRGQGKPDE
jgi:glycerol-3-phosphate O-acyltransferase / dihydroxyacetone phosphate acyltransferase